MSFSWFQRFYSLLAGLLLVGLEILSVNRLWQALHTPLYFDDAYMFARYAANIRHGFGISWNPDGLHTYGQTAPLWGLVVLVGSFLPVAAPKMLMVASWVCSMGAVIAMAWAVATNAESTFLRSTFRVLPLVAIPLAATEMFWFHAPTGMETMLGMLLSALFVGVALRWQRGAARPVWVGVVGLLLFATRPEAAIAVIMMPVMLFVLMPGVTRRELATALGIFFAGVALEMFVCKLYFGTALPLSFYMKSLHGYEGYAKDWHAGWSLLLFLGSCRVYLIVMILMARGKDWWLLACVMVPALETFAYLMTVMQIMGFEARYYLPYYAFFAVPGLLVLDKWLSRRDVAVLAVEWERTAMRLGVAVLVVGFFFAMEGSWGAQLQAAMQKPIEVYAPVQLQTVAQAPLPDTGWVATTEGVADMLVTALPAGATVAASEVGYLGEQAPQVNVIDLTGLNDPQIALHGFSMRELMARRPDLIWMPHTDYTWQRGVILSDPELLAKYDVYAGMGEYGIALRRDSPYFGLMQQNAERFWYAFYPGYRMSDDKVLSAMWTGEKYRQ